MLKDTHLFSAVAKHYIEYGHYTDALPGTKQYYVSMKNSQMGR